MAATKEDVKTEPSAAEQAAAQKATQEGVTASDAQKDANVAAGGFNGQGIPPGPSGAIMEAQIRQDQQMEHPAVDSQPRKGLPEVAIRIDFNDPSF